jgi:membrane-associated phospholipid phosphatase
MLQAHFVSDIAVAGLVAWAVGAWLWRRHEARIERYEARVIEKYEARVVE